MNFEDLQHVLHAAADAADLQDGDELIVIGSQAMLASHPELPAEMTASMEADVYPAKDPSLAEKIDGALGDGSSFHQQFGYYAHGVDEKTATLPAGWYERAVRMPIQPRGNSRRQAVAVFPQPEDLVLSKLAAWRDRDMDYAVHAMRHGLADLQTMLDRIEDLPVDRAEQTRARTTLRELAKLAGIIS